MPDVAYLEDLRSKLDEYLKRIEPCATPLWTTAYGITFVVNIKATKNWALSERPCSLFRGVIRNDADMFKTFMDDMCVKIQSYDASGKYKNTEKYCGCDKGPKHTWRTFHRRRDCVKYCPCNILIRTCPQHGREYQCDGTGEWKRKDHCICAECEQRRTDNKERRAGPARKKVKTMA
jgi:hypothetical protein